MRKIWTHQETVETGTAKDSVRHGSDTLLHTALTLHGALTLWCGWLRRNAGPAGRGGAGSLPIDHKNPASKNSESENPETEA